MPPNLSWHLSYRFSAALQKDLTSGFQEDFATEEIMNYVDTALTGQARKTVCSIPDTLFTMLLTAVMEDRSLQSPVNIFKHYYERQSTLIQLKKEEMPGKERLSDALREKKQVARKNTKVSRVKVSPVK